MTMVQNHDVSYKHNAEKYLEGKQPYLHHLCNLYNITLKKSEI
jgi:hypothetical protein